MEHYRIPVIIEEHANAAALAQFWYSKETNNTDVLVYVAFAQGIGAGIVNNGTLLKGSDNARFFASTCTGGCSVFVRSVSVFSSFLSTGEI